MAPLEVMAAVSDWFQFPGPRVQYPLAFVPITGFIGLWAKKKLHVIFQNPDDRCFDVQVTFEKESVPDSRFQGSNPDASKPPEATAWRVSHGAAQVAQDKVTLG